MSSPVVVCANCGAKETEARRFQVCSACKSKAPSTKYCSVECQRQHWPLHKDICKLLVKAIDNQKKGLSAMSAAERASFATEKQWMQWSSKAPCSEPLTRLVHRVLGDKQDTHVAVINVDVRPDRLPIFIVVSARAMTDAEAEREMRIPLERIQANRKQMSSSGYSSAAAVHGGALFGLAFFDDGRGKRPCSLVLGMLQAEVAHISATTTVDYWILKVNNAARGDASSSTLK